MKQQDNRVSTSQRQSQQQRAKNRKHDGSAEIDEALSLLRWLLRRQVEVGLEASVHAQQGSETLVDLNLEGCDGVRLAINREVALRKLRLDAECVRLIVVLLVGGIPVSARGWQQQHGHVESGTL